ncbi:serine hydrolase [Sphingomonas bisphenolicum]|uniref:Serine hydrolase n=2 Tax=Sphingomonas bisphenolicum TaxID=296544 RepID=A0ABN5WKD3_9SPHN|nr:serine hydrolase [Sphingomonas bisphenolicum]
MWGGYQDAAKTRPWHEDTIVCCMSSSKGVTAICFMMAVDRGLIDIHAPVARYWPEFAQNGKADLPIRFVLDHRAGLPYIEELGPGTLYDYDAVIAQLAKQKPLWEPGTVAAYHVISQGFLLGEILRRTTGMKVGEFFRSQVAEPLGIDYHLGLRPDESARCADFLVPPDVFAGRHSPEPTVMSLGFAQFPDQPMDIVLNAPEWRVAEVASGSGHGNARALARLWSAVANGGTLDGVRLMSEKAVRLLGTMQHEEVEQRANKVYRQGLGLLLNSPPTMGFGPNPDSFGHGGVGGSLGFVDPARRLSYGYTPNRMHNTLAAGPRADRLVEATFACTP